MNLPHDPSEEKCGDWWFRHVTSLDKALMGVRTAPLNLACLTVIAHRNLSAGALSAAALERGAVRPGKDLYYQSRKNASVQNHITSRYSSNQRFDTSLCCALRQSDAGTIQVCTRCTTNHGVKKRKRGNGGVPDTWHESDVSSGGEGAREKRVRIPRPLER
eukprot:754452-Hanusia_phi.AAC.15